MCVCTHSQTRTRTRETNTKHTQARSRDLQSAVGIGFRWTHRLISKTYRYMGCHSLPLCLALCSRERRHEAFGDNLRVRVKWGGFRVVRRGAFSHFDFSRPLLLLVLPAPNSLHQLCVIQMTAELFSARVCCCCLMLSPSLPLGLRMAMRSLYECAVSVGCGLLDFPVVFSGLASTHPHTLG